MKSCACRDPGRKIADGTLHARFRATVPVYTQHDTPAVVLGRDPKRHPDMLDASRAVNLPDHPFLTGLDPPGIGVGARRVPARNPVALVCAQRGQRRQAGLADHGSSLAECGRGSSGRGNAVNRPSLAVIRLVRTRQTFLDGQQPGPPAAARTGSSRPCSRSRCSACSRDRARWKCGSSSETGSDPRCDSGRPCSCPSTATRHCRCTG